MDLLFLLVLPCVLKGSFVQCFASNHGFQCVLMPFFKPPEGPRKGPSKSKAPEGPSKSKAPEGLSKSKAPEGPSKSKAPEGLSKSKAPVDPSKNKARVKGGRRALQ